MKKIIYFTVAVVLAMGIWACSEDGEQSITNQEREDAILAYKALDATLIEPSKDVTIEYATLEELNVEMVKFGMAPLEPLSEERLQELRKEFGPVKKSTVCDAVLAYGDINYSGSVTVTDVALANLALSKCDKPNVNGRLPEFYEIVFCSNLTYLQRKGLTRAGLIAHVNPSWCTNPPGAKCNVEFTVSERDLMRAFLLGQISC